MRKSMLLLAIGLLVSSGSQAKKIAGQIIFEHDTLDVVFNIPLHVYLFGKEPDIQRLQYRVKYYDASGKKHLLKPDKVREIRFNYDAEPIRMVSETYKGPENIFSKPKPIFLKLEIDGEAKMFSYYEIRRPRGVPSIYVHRVVQKGGGEIKMPKGWSFRKDMAAYFHDCPELSQKIENGAFRKSELDAIVRFYNVTCGK